MRLLIILMLNGLLVLAFAGGGSWLALEQHQRLTSWEPTTAIVTASPIGPPGQTASALEYGYEFQGGTYKSRQLTPLGLLAREATMHAMAAELAVGQATTAWVNPRNPHQAFLKSVPGFLPFGVLLLAPLLLLVFVPKLIEGGVLGRRPEASLTEESDYYLAAPESTLRGGQLLMLGAAAAWWLYGLVVMGTYAACGGIVGEGVVLAAIAWLLVPTPLLYRCRRLHHIARCIEDASVGTALAAPCINRPIVCHMRQKLLTPLVIREAVIAIMCHRRDGLTSERLYIESQPISRPRQTNAEEVLHLCHVFEIPERKRRASSHFSRLDFPRIDWSLEVRLRADGGIEYVARFPIRLVDAPEQSARNAA
ncbi:MAG: DUF3592 domain-containing protein [Phycisphaeraceae bacterium]|nr:DUF3592 domain-containing protein [Phycisphaeraceae bacterium]